MAVFSKLPSRSLPNFLENDENGGQIQPLSGKSGVVENRRRTDPEAQE
jgi:hypothetical protein